MLTEQQLKQILSYDPDTGEWTWLISTSPKAQAGQKAGCINKQGRRQIAIEGKTYKSYRLAFLYMTGKWPDRWVDHINKDTSDDRWFNLRLATPKQNAMNRTTHLNNSSGKKGVCWHKHYEKWWAYIMLNGYNKNLGFFDRIDDAILARKQAEVIYFGEYNGD